MFDPNPTPNSLPHAMGPQVEAPMAGQPQQPPMDPAMMKRVADMLRGNPAGQGGMVGKHFVPTTGLQHLGNLAGNIGSSYISGMGQPAAGGAGGMSPGALGGFMSLFGK